MADEEFYIPSVIRTVYLSDLIVTVHSGPNIQEEPILLNSLIGPLSFYNESTLS